MRTFIWACIAGALLTTHAFARADILLQAVAFALTGNDSAAVQIIDREACVFQISRDDTRKVFFLNNVQVDRISIWDYTTKMPHNSYVIVELHGSENFYESHGTTFLNKGDLHPDIAKMMKRNDPGIFKPKEYFNQSNQHSFRISTSEADRVIRAWKYIYENGCTGTRSPF